MYIKYSVFLLGQFSVSLVRHTRYVKQSIESEGIAGTIKEVIKYY